jgi:outer membrane protein OmpA-like peptidoglycan-associated protein
MSGFRRVSAGLATAAFCATLVLAGCASLGGGRTQVILLPDEDGHVGAVSVTSAGGSRALDAAYAQVTVSGATASPAPPAALGRASVEKSYEELLHAQPSRPRSFTLNFLLDSTTLTDESKALLPEVLRAARERSPTEVAVFGHADASGSELHNTRLSSERARSVAALLRKADPTMVDIDVQWFGDRQPLVRSESREPRNRRVEIQIL